MAAMQPNAGLAEVSDKLDRLHDEFRAFRASTETYRSETEAFQSSMLEFRSDMEGFKSSMLGFRDDTRREFARVWAELVRIRQEMVTKSFLAEKLGGIKADSERLLQIAIESAERNKTYFEEMLSHGDILQDHEGRLKATTGAWATWNAPPSPRARPRPRGRKSG